MLTLWADVPEHQRITREYLGGCNGASDSSWTERVWQKIENPQCRAAVKWGGSSLFAPCRQLVLGGDFCPIHGGLRLKKPPAPGEEIRARALNSLQRRSGMRWDRLPDEELLAEAAQLTDEELRGIRGLGQKSLVYIRTQRAEDAHAPSIQPPIWMRH